MFLVPDIRAYTRRGKRRKILETNRDRVGNIQLHESNKETQRERERKRYAIIQLYMTYTHRKKELID